MVLWIGIIGALTGWLLSQFASYGFVIGGLIGLALGQALRTAIRKEIAAATDPLQAQIDLLLAGRSAAQAPVEVALPPMNPRDVARPPAAVRTPPSAALDLVGEPGPRIVPDAADDEVEPPRSPAPNALEHLLAAARNWLFGGNTIVRVGLVVLFIGLSFLARYAAAAGLLPIEVRLSFVAAVGIALLGIGYRTRGQRPEFALALQGGGVATIYLTLFAAARLYDTVPLTAAFVLMILVCALGCALALLQRSQALALTSFIGGFAVPLLLSSGGGNVAIVFAYYTVLNVAILFIAERRTWRGLNLIGFFATFGFATLWQATGYTPADFVPTQINLILSVLIYVATAILYARAMPGRLGGVVDTTLLFGPAVAGFALQVALVRDLPFGSAFAALGFAALYLGIAATSMRYGGERLRVANETMLAVAIGFVTLAIPLALDARWTSATWALEGAGAFWVGMRQARWMPRLFGLLLQAIAALLYLAGIGPNVAALPFANPGFVGAMIVALAAFATAWWLLGEAPAAESPLGRAYRRFERVIAEPTFLTGFFFWWLAFVVEVCRSLPVLEVSQAPVPVFDTGTRILLAMLGYIVSAWGWQAIGRRTGWAVARWPSHASLAALVFGFLLALEVDVHVLSLPAPAVWIPAIGLLVYMTYRNDRDTRQPWQDAALRAAHIGGVWLGTAMLADCLWFGIDRLRPWQTAWAEVTFLASLVAVLVVLTVWAARAIGQSVRWPLDRHATDYAWYAAVPLAGLAYGGAILVALFSSGNAYPLPYVPLINPVDLTLALTLGALTLWHRTVTTASPSPPGTAVLHGPAPLAALALLAFVIVNTIWLRVAHQLVGVAWSADALFASRLVQTGLAILWTLIALVLMVTAHRRGQRTRWLVGAALLALTVAKLVLVDVNAVGGGAQIVAFIAVGVLMLVVGYLAPLPPRSSDAGGDA